MLRRILYCAVVGTALIAMPVLAQTYEEGAAAYKKNDFGHAARVWQPLAEQGSAKAQSSLAFLYAQGLGVGRSTKEAVKWWSAAAAQNYVEAELNLGMTYAKGDGIDKDPATAAKWLRKAADSGNSEAQTVLGGFYNRGDGVARDDKEAVRWFRTAARQGHTPAMSYLAAMYETGQGVPADKVKAHMYFNLAGAASSGKEADTATANRDRVGATLTPDQVKQARELARKCMASNYQKCD